nr:hypothetical protein Z952_p0199 [Clostridium botulinum C/D str. BKT75002]KEI05346.1 hypothetical protein Z954_0200 [Clostridium botulinum C/D str. BKT2873]
MDFTKALELIKIGDKLARIDWRGTGMYVTVCNTPDFQPFVYIKTSEGTTVPWLPSQTDLFAKDWEIFKDGWKRI